MLRLVEQEGGESHRGWMDPELGRCVHTGDTFPQTVMTSVLPEIEELGRDGGAHYTNRQKALTCQCLNSASGVAHLNGCRSPHKIPSSTSSLSPLPPPESLLIAKPGPVTPPLEVLNEELLIVLRRKPSSPGGSCKLWRAGLCFSLVLALTTDPTSSPQTGLLGIPSLQRACSHLPLTPVSPALLSILGCHSSPRLVQAPPWGPHGLPCPSFWCWSLGVPLPVYFSTSLTRLAHSRCPGNVY